MKKIADVTRLVKDIVEEHIKKGDSVVDATMGNGKDTLWLSKMTGTKGKVYCFEIQNNAATKALDMLYQRDTEAAIELIFRGHEVMDKMIEEKVSAVIFNLGYLPGGDKEITTKAETTVAGINAALKILKKGGIVAVTCYTGHPEGKKERDAVLKLASELDRKKYHAANINYPNQGEDAPEIVFIISK